MMLQGTLPLQLLPAHSSVLSCLRVEQEDESRAGEVPLCRDIHLLCCPSPHQRDSACAARGQGHVKGGFTEARGVFPTSVFACAQVRAFPAQERCLLLRSCLLWPHPRGLGTGHTAPNSALFVLWEGAFTALLSQQQQAKSCGLFSPQSLPRETLQTDPTSSRYVQSTR